MSRIGNAPIPVPSGVDVDVREGCVTVKGPKGELARELPPVITLDRDGDTLLLHRANEERHTRALHGLSRALLANMVTGVSAGFEKRMQLVGTGYRTSLQGTDLEILVGYSHPVRFPPPAGIEFTVPDATHIVVRGIDKELVGETAARIRKIRPPEPYKGKGIRYEDERIRRKAGKAAKVGGK